MAQGNGCWNQQLPMAQIFLDALHMGGHPPVQILAPEPRKMFLDVRAAGGQSNRISLPPSSYIISTPIQYVGYIYISVYDFCSGWTHMDMGYISWAPKWMVKCWECSNLLDPLLSFFGGRNPFAADPQLRHTQSASYAIQLQQRRVWRCLKTGEVHYITTINPCIGGSLRLHKIAM